MKEIIGNIVETESDRIKTARIHQGWWRAFVLGKNQGLRPHNNNERICNTVEVDKEFEVNFLSSEIAEVVNQVLEERKKDSPGLIQEERLRGNLLSSQPLCFNFFGTFHQDKNFAKQVLTSFYPGITEVKDVLFEYAPTPKDKYTNDNSAFDVAIEVVIDGKLGIIGFECKYTETFSPKEYRTEKYENLYNSSKSFVGSYEELTSSKFNQLFRNQLIAESLLQSRDNKYSFVNTALFCASEDDNAQKTGDDFGKLLNSAYSNFKIITFFDFIESMQQNNITKKQREFSMLLWARYIGYQLSSQARKEYIAGNKHDSPECRK